MYISVDPILGLNKHDEADYAPGKIKNILNKY